MTDVTRPVRRLAARRIRSALPRVSAARAVITKEVAKKSGREFDQCMCCHADVMCRSHDANAIVYSNYCIYMHSDLTVTRGATRGLLRFFSFSPFHLLLLDVSDHGDQKHCGGGNSATNRGNAERGAAVGTGLRRRVRSCSRLLTSHHGHWPPEEGQQQEAAADSMHLAHPRP